MRILFVDNHPEFTDVVTRAFLSKHDVVVVATIAGACGAAQASTFDVALVDYDLDDGKGDDFVRWVRATSALRFPIIAVSAHADGNSALVRAGADHVCSKSEFSKIAALLDSALRARS